MTLHSPPFLIHGTYGSLDTTTAQKHSVWTKAKIIGLIVGGVVFLLLLAFAAVCFFRIRSRRKRARQGTKLRETGEGDEEDEEAKPMVQQGKVGLPRPLMMQGATHFPPHGEQMYGGSGYGAPTEQVLYDHDLGEAPAGQRGTEFYRNQ